MPLTQITTVLFDIGNTLVMIDYRQIVNAAARQNVHLTVGQLLASEYAGKRAIDRQIETRTAGTDETRWSEFFLAILHDLHYPENLLPDLMDELQRLDDIGFGLWSMKNPDTDSVLNGLYNRDYRLGVISNADGRVAGLIESIGIKNYFFTVIDSHEVGVEKPDPSIFNLALDMLSIKPSQAVYVGDLYSVDIIGARSAGITPVLFDPLNTYQVNDCLKIASLKEVLDILPEKPAE
ncbi:HAD family hydrolase [candidate division KSB1 bacterium]